MTPARKGLSLRRSEMLATPTPENVTINDDEEERRQARRRTILQTAGASDTSILEDSETLKQCMEIYNGNKLSRDNAWSLSLIDTLSKLLDRHHKSLNNFKVAGSSLEASTKVYGLRVDSIHTDVLRMSAGLNAQQFVERNEDEEDDDDAIATGGEGSADPNNSAAGAEKGPEKAVKAKPKRQRKAVSTITKNKDTLNARLDTVPLQDPVFGKLNSIVGSINSSNRLMNNILRTTDSELRLRTNFRLWHDCELEECDYTAEVPLPDQTADSENEFGSCDRLVKVAGGCVDELQLRPLHGGYIISDTPENIAPEEKRSDRLSLDSNGAADCDFHDANELSMAFDINAECEPMPLMSEKPPIIDVDYANFEDLSTEELTAINKCRGLRKESVFIEDLRPVDSSSKLEYSYRPLDKISQFWAGPSHWKFKSVINRFSTLTQQSTDNITQRTVGCAAPRNRRTQATLMAKRRSKQLNFNEYHDELYIKLDSKYKMRKVNVQKNWDHRKLKLPTDLHLDPDMFFKYEFAPGLRVEPDLESQGIMIPDVHSVGDDDDGISNDMHNFDDDTPVESNFMNVSPMGSRAHMSTNALDLGLGEQAGGDGDCVANNTVLEIATEFEGAPTQVTKIIVPFARRAKVVDMKNLKRCCTQVLTKNLKRDVDENLIPKHPRHEDESYVDGVASFSEIYKELPSMLTTNMTEALTPSVAFYSMLHLANDLNLRLIPQDDLKDFKIRQVRE